MVETGRVRVVPYSGNRPPDRKDSTLVLVLLGHINPGRPSQQCGYIDIERRRDLVECGDPRCLLLALLQLADQVSAHAGPLRQLALCHARITLKAKLLDPLTDGARTNTHAI